MIIKKQFALLIMLMSFPVGAAVWFWFFNYIAGDQVAIHRLAKQGFLISLLLVTLSKRMTKTKEEGEDYYSLVDVFVMLMGWVGIALSMGVVVFFFKY
jgi:hypothetical protein